MKSQHSDRSKETESRNMPSRRTAAQGCACSPRPIRSATVTTMPVRDWKKAAAGDKDDFDDAA